MGRFGLLFLFFCSSCFAAQSVSNLLTNPSFEKVSGDLPDGWTVTDKVKVSVEKGDAIDGSHWLHLQRQDGASYALTYQSVAVKPNTGYRLRAWIRTPDWNIYSLSIYDAVMNGIGGLSTGWAMFTKWTELQCDFRTRPNDTSIKIGLQSWGANVEWDAVRLWEDDSVRIGDLSPATNPLPQPTEPEKARGFLLFTRPLESSTSARYVPLREECLSPDQPLAATCLPGERETVMVMMHALRDLNGIRLRCAELPKELNPEDVSLFQVGYGKRTLSAQSFVRYPLLMLPPPTAGRILPPEAVKQGDVLQYAIRLHVPERWPSRELGLTMMLETASTSTPLNIHVRVPAVHLDPAKPSFFMYYNDSYFPEAMATKAMQELYYRDMAEHGMNAVSLYVGPERAKEGGGFELDLEHDLNYKTSDTRHNLGLQKRFERIQAAGLADSSRPLILLGTDLGSFRDVETVRSLIKLQQSRKWPELLFYVSDEPDNEERASGVKGLFARLYSQVPEARTVTAIDKHGIELVGRLYDVWITAILDINDKMIIQARDMKKELWGYDCRQRGQIPKFDRFLCGFYTWRTNLRGLGQWAYYSTKPLTRNDDGSWAVPAAEWNDDQHWYMMPSDRGPVATIGWEARREGIEDYRCLQTLKRLVSTGNSKAAVEGRALLEQVNALIPVDCFGTSPINQSYIWDYDPVPAMTVSRMHRLRHRMIDLIAELQNR